METVSQRDRPDSYISTGHLPPPDQIAALVEEAYEKFKSNREGQRSSVYPSLAAAREELFGLCVVGTDGRL
jgi:glutaminase